MDENTGMTHCEAEQLYQLSVAPMANEPMVFAAGYPLTDTVAPLTKDHYE